MYALVDCNNFYCSCERVFNPRLNGKPVVVLSNNDGCAIARSEEAKALGIAMGTPAFMIEAQVKKHDVAVFSSNYTLYGDMSDRVMKTLAVFVPRLEIYSIDEAYLDLNDMVYCDLLKLAMNIRKTVLRNTGIPVSVGIAPTKTLAKMANHYAKKRYREIGIYYAASDSLVEGMLKNTAVGDICGIGHRHALRLTSNNISTAWDFANMPSDWVRTYMSVVGLRLQNELKGIPSIEDEFEPKKKKNISHSRSFGDRLTEKKDIQEAVANYAADCARKLREQKCCCRKMQVFIQTNPHKTDEEQYMQAIDIQLERASNNTSEILKYAIRGLNLIFKQGLRYMKAGVILMDIIPEDAIQGNLFDTEGKRNNNQVMEAMDRINKSLGKDVLRFAVQGFEKRYSLQAAMLSPKYTTDIAEILKVRI
jgi:DNA polymerase V